MTNQNKPDASEMIELTEAALDAVAGGHQGRGADDPLDPPEAEAPGDHHRQRGK